MAFKKRLKRRSHCVPRSHRDKKPRAFTNLAKRMLCHSAQPFTQLAMMQKTVITSKKKQESKACMVAL